MAVPVQLMNAMVRDASRKSTGVRRSRWETHDNVSGYWE